MDLSPRLVPTRVPRAPKAAVLVLHGGASRGERRMVSPTQLSVLRMLPVARRVARAGGDRLAVYRLLNSARGWDSETTPVHDVAWALEQVRADLGDLPVGLVGHSLGGRAALLAGAREGVASVVALNPWLYPTDGADLRGRRVLFVHGTADRIAPLTRAETVARRLARDTEVGFVAVHGARHAMLGQGKVFEHAAAEWVRSTLLGVPADQVRGPVREILEGRARVDHGAREDA